MKLSLHKLTSFPYSHQHRKSKTKIPAVKIPRHVQPKTWVMSSLAMEWTARSEFSAPRRERGDVALTITYSLVGRKTSELLGRVGVRGWAVNVTRATAGLPLSSFSHLLPCPRRTDTIEQPTRPTSNSTNTPYG